MDKRSWLWKRKASDKAAAGSDAENAYVKTSAESQAYLIGLEHQVKSLEGQIKILNEKLYSAQTEIITKDDLVKQHGKVAEEAVAGWEKAEAEASALKHRLESVTLQKLTAQEQASHFDDALKECMKQIQVERKENEQKIQDIVLAKTKQWERMKFDLEAKMAALEQDILGSSAENAVLQKLLQESSDALFRAREAKSQAEEEIELLKANILSYEKEANSLRYELQITLKELEIRNEEKNMSVRFAEAANKQHLEDVRKITKLEAECQRLRGFLRKRLPGPATIAQMKLEVENIGLDHAENKVKRSPVKVSSPRHGSESEYSFNNSQQLHKENEFLTARLLTMEEEMKMLQEALSSRNNELLITRELYAKTASELSNSANSHVASNKKSTTRSNVMPFHEHSSVHSPPSLTSISGDGIDDEGSCSESCAATSLASQNFQFRNGNDVTKGTKDGKFACLQSTKTAGTNSSIHPQKDNIREEQTFEIPMQARSILISEFESRIESQDLDTNMRNLFKDIKNVMQVRREALPQNATPAISEELSSAITKIHHFVFSLCSSEKHTQIKNTVVLTESFKKVLNNEMNVCNYILALSSFISEMDKMCDKTKGDASSDDYIDKVTLLENKIVDEVLQEEFLKPYSDQNVIQEKCSSEEFKQLKIDNERRKLELTSYREALDKSNLRLVLTERHLEELKSKLTVSQNSNSMVETQLKCMVESYKTLESRSQELESELNELRVTAANLDKELQEERCAHQEDMEKYKDLFEQIKRNESGSSCKSQSDADAEIKRKQVLEIEEAAEKLAECQETIILLGRQLESLQPSGELEGPSPSARHQINSILENDGSEIMVKLHGSEIDQFASTAQNKGEDDNLCGSSDMKTSSKHHKQRSFSRFFSKGKTEN